MTDRTVEHSQQKAAKVAGAIFLLVLVSSIFPQFFGLPGLFASGDATTVANRISDSETLFRISIVNDLFVAAADVVLGLAIYVLLKPVNKNLALLALSYRLVECVILGFIPVFHFIILVLLSGDEYLAAFEAGQLHALVILLHKAYGVGYIFGVILFSFGSMVYSYLLFKARYVPRLLSLWGIFASVLLCVSFSASVVLPDETKILFPASLMPIAVFELLLGLWFLFKGVDISPTRARNLDTNSA